MNRFMKWQPGRPFADHFLFGAVNQDALLRFLIAPFLATSGE